MIKIFVLLILYPVILFLDIFRIFMHIKFCQIYSSSFGGFVDQVEGFLLNRDEFDELKNCKIIFFLEKNVSNLQIKRMSQRIFKIYDYNIILDYIYRLLIYYKKNLYILDLNTYSALKFRKHLKRKKTQLYFTEQENEKGLNYLKNFGLKKNAKWVCIFNRDSKYLNIVRPGGWPGREKNWNYHSYRNSSVQSLLAAAKLFTEKGYYVFRMGKHVNERFNVQDSKIIDYANSDINDDFFDIFLLANCEFFLGGDSGVNIIPIIFEKPTCLFNCSCTLFSRYLNYGNKICLYIFKRLKDNDSKKLLSLSEILESKFAYSTSSNVFRKYNVEPVDNSEEEIKQLAIEICKLHKGENIETEEDKKLQEKFWHIYFNKINNNKVNENLTNRDTYFLPKISPSFLRKNLDLLN